MKKILGIALFLFCQFANAQNYIAIPDSGAIWMNTMFSFNTLPAQYYSYIYTTHGLDTLINNTNYFVLHTNVNGPYYGAIRNDAGKVYIVPKDSMQEYLVYDFTAHVGDTINQIFEDGGLLTFNGGIESIVVVDTGTIDLGDGIIRRKIYTSNARTWIEGIGSTNGLFSEDSDNVSSYGGYLNCFSVNNNVFYPNFSNGICSPTAVDFIKQNESKLIFPNPAQNNLTITSNDLGQLQIFDMLGCLIFQHSLKAVSEAINIEFLPQGIYVVKVGYSIQKLIKE